MPEFAFYHCRIFIMLMVGLLAVTGGPLASYGVEPNEVLSDEKLEARARKLSLELRCLVCQNQSIDDSNAPLARDLRLLVRERLQKGDSDQEVLDFVVARYGEFVLLRPPFGWHTLILWLTPWMVLGLAFWLARGLLKRNVEPGLGSTGPSQLSEEEKASLAKMLKDDRSPPK